MQTTYQAEWDRQKSRTGLPEGHIPVHRWYLKLEKPESIEAIQAPRDDLHIERAHNPTIEFYRFLYHSAGQEFLWGDRRRMSDEQLKPMINPVDVHVMVLYQAGTPAGFFEMDFRLSETTEIKYFALLPGFLGGGLGGYLLNWAIRYAGAAKKIPLILDTCTLDHSSALENYRKRGFEVYREEDEEYLDPRLDGSTPLNAGAHVPMARMIKTDNT